MSQQREQQRQKPDWEPSPEQIRTWIREGLDKEVEGINGVDQCQKFGNHLAKKDEMSTSQVRKFFGALKKLQSQIHNNEDLESNYHELLMLKPQLAYAAGKNKRNTKNFKNVLTQCIDNIERREKQHFCNFVRFVEATVAYHKAAGGE